MKLWRRKKNGSFAEIMATVYGEHLVIHPTSSQHMWLYHLTSAQEGWV
jgi:hypothetical protein